MEEIHKYFASKEVEDTVKKLKELCKKIKDKVTPEVMALSLDEEVELFTLVRELVSKIPQEARKSVGLTLPTKVGGVVVTKVVTLDELELVLRSDLHALSTFVNIMAQDIEVSVEKVPEEGSKFQGGKTLVINSVYGHDVGASEALWYCQPYLDFIHKYALSKGVTSRQLICSDAVKEVVWDVHRNERPMIIVGNGHGSEDTFTGYKLNKVYWVDMEREGFDKSWVTGATFLMISCLTGAKLGPYMVEKLGVYAYLGWKKEFTFIVKRGYRWVSNDWRKSPDVLYLRPPAEAFAKVVTGEWSVEKAYNYIKETWENYLRDSSIPLFYKQWIAWDLNNMVLIKRGSLVMFDGAGVSEEEELGEEGVEVRVTLEQDGKSWTLINKKYRLGRHVEEVNLPKDVQPGEAMLKFFVNNVLKKIVKIKLVKRESGEKKEYDINVIEPREGQEVDIEKPLRIVFEVFEKVVKPPEEVKYTPIVVEYTVKSVVSMLEARYIGRAIDCELPINFDKVDEHKCLYVLGSIPIPYTKFGEKIYLPRGRHRIEVAVAGEENEKATVEVVVKIGSIESQQVVAKKEGEVSRTQKLVLEFEI